MKAIIVYESHWGNTAAIARAIAEGIGPEAQAMSTAEAMGGALAGVDLIVAGAPLLGFSLPTESMVKSLNNPMQHRIPPDLSHPSMRAWLEQLPAGSGRSAGFETRIWWSPGSAAKSIGKALAEKGYAAAGGPEKFIVKDRYGPLKDGEIERVESGARNWHRRCASAPP